MHHQAPRHLPAITAQHKTTTEAFYQAVREAYFQMRAVKKDGARLYTDEYIYTALGRRFFRAPRTIENIVWHRVSPPATTT